MPGVKQHPKYTQKFTGNQFSSLSRRIMQACWGIPRTVTPLHSERVWFLSGLQGQSHEEHIGIVLHEVIKAQMTMRRSGTSDNSVQITSCYRKELQV